MQYSQEVENMCPVAKGAYHGPAPIPEEGKWVQAKEISDISGKTILEALNTDLVCDAINVAMREIFLQIVYGRSQTAFSEGGLPVGASLDDLGKGLRSQVGTMFGTKAKGARYLELAQGYVTRMALNEKAKGHYGQWDNAAKYIDPRTDEETHSVASVFPVHE